MYVTNIKNIGGFSNPITKYNLDIMQSIVTDKEYIFDVKLAFRL
jgi:hypothetical protein|tara:strand:+ start:7027 stop:7158 length:132 start_codon:yes stop_codon:yes gene_type:complete